MSIGEELKKQRQALQLSQSHLSQLSGLSLASIQNMEAGKANWSISNLAAVLEVLGFELKLETRLPEWDRLIDFGLPVLAEGARERAGYLPIECLERLLVGACAQLLRQTNQQGAAYLREKEALQALLMALQEHYPSFYRQHLSNYKILKVFYPRPEEMSGKLIKLRRIAKDQLARYL